MIHTATHVPPLTAQRYIAWGRFAPLGAVSLLAGIEGRGKSILTAGVSAATSKAGWNVILSNKEDQQQQTRARLEASGANLDRIYMPTRPYLFPRDNELFVADVEKSNARLVFLDPASEHIAASLSHDQATRRILEPLDAIADNYDLALVIIGHTARTASRSQSILHTILGPGLTRKARTVAMLGRHPYGTKNDRALCIVKDSYRELPDAVGLRIDTVDVGGVPVARMVATCEHEQIDPYDLFDPTRTPVRSEPIPVMRERLRVAS